MSQRRQSLGTVKIIGGRWRGRSLSFPALLNVRPTLGLVRERLFNWLMHDLDGAVCLDLFAGSGALGFEALSRGAKAVTWVDRSPEVISSILSHCQQLQVPDTQYDGVVADVTRSWPALRFAPYDIVFLDPPYQESVLIAVLEELQQRQLLAPSALIYIELSHDKPIIDWINHKRPNWTIKKEKRAGSALSLLVEATK